MDRSKPSNPRELLAREIQRRREQLGLTQAQLAEMLVCSESLVGHYESGRRRPPAEMLAHLDRILDADGMLLRIADTLNSGPQTPQWLAIVDAEKDAMSICDYAANLVPGLLQTPSYARAVYRAARPTAAEVGIEKSIRERMERAQVLSNPESPSYWVIIHETVLRTPVGGPAVMAEQLRHVAELVRAHRIMLQVLPFSVGAHALMEGMCRLMTFAEAPDLAYSEGPSSGVIHDDPVRVRELVSAYNLVRASALHGQASLDLIEAAAKDYDDASPPCF